MAPNGIFKVLSARVTITMSEFPGPIALVGSGEYLPVMQHIEACLLTGRNPIYVQLPTAAAPEGDDSLRRWIDLGKKQAERIGVTQVPVVVRNQSEANDPKFAELIKGAGLIYLSGGNPHFLADTLRDSLVWQAIRESWEAGAALAGCSAGAMAIADHIPALRLHSPRETRGLGVLPHIRVLPHFDKMFGWIPDLATRIFDIPDGVHVVGIDEETALIGGPFEWEVHGRQSVWLLRKGHREQFSSGQKIVINAC